MGGIRAVSYPNAHSGAGTEGRPCRDGKRSSIIESGNRRPDVWPVKRRQCPEPRTPRPASTSKYPRCASPRSCIRPVLSTRPASPADAPTPRIIQQPPGALDPVEALTPASLAMSLIAVLLPAVLELLTMFSGTQVCGLPGSAFFEPWTSGQKHRFQLSLLCPSSGPVEVRHVNPSLRSARDQRKVIVFAGQDVVEVH